jgi:hypothetical protein
VLGPISLRSPPALCFISYASGSTFQARYHSPGLLSHEPLGTFSIMLAELTFVKQNLYQNETFPQFYECLVSYSYRQGDVHRRWKNQNLANMFPFSWRTSIFHEATHMISRNAHHREHMFDPLSPKFESA